jgi:hypothetical protein
MTEAVARNVSLAEGGDPGKIARAALALAAQIDAATAEELLAGRLPR